LQHGSVIAMRQIREIGADLATLAANRVALRADALLAEKDSASVEPVAAGQFRSRALRLFWQRTVGGLGPRQQDSPERKRSQPGVLGCQAREIPKQPRHFY